MTFPGPRSMPVPNLKACDVLHIVLIALDQLGSSVTLNSRRLPPTHTIVGKEETNETGQIGILTGLPWERCLQI